MGHRHRVAPDARPDTPTNESGLIQLIRMGKSISHSGLNTKQIKIFFPGADLYNINYMYMKDLYNS